MIKRETFLKHGARIYIALLVSSVGFLLLGITEVINYVVGLILFAVFGYLAGNVKLSHGYLFSVGGMKFYNGILLTVFNLVCLGWLLYFLGLYLGILSP